MPLLIALPVEPADDSGVVLAVDPLNSMHESKSRGCGRTFSLLIFVLSGASFYGDVNEREVVPLLWRPYLWIGRSHLS